MSHHDLHDLDSLAQTQVSIHDHGMAAPATPHKRTLSLSLRDKQWDGLFSSSPPKPVPKNKAATPPREPPNSLSEQAQAVSRSKQQANKRSQGGRTHKRKRSGSRDDIFRTKKLPDKSQPAATLPNPLSRFLSSHPVFAHSLCFATPVKDSNDTDYNNNDPKDGTSTVVSDTNSLNNSTADDTMTSTVYYETTKLAGLLQKSPPMPLFNNHCLQERDDINDILQTLQQEQDQLDAFVNKNNNAHGRLVVCGGGKSSVKKDLFAAKVGANGSHVRSSKAGLTVVGPVPEQAPAAVYCSSSSHSSGGSKGVVARRISKQARQT